MGHPVKQRIINELAREFADVDSCVLVSYRGVSAEQVRSFRRTLAEHDLSMRIVRNSLAAKAFVGTGLAPVTAHFDGPTAVIYRRDPAGGSSIAAARLVTAWNRQKKNAPVAPAAALNDGEVVDGEGVAVIARLPDRPTVRGMLAAAVIGAARGLAMSVNGVGGGLARCLQARIDQQGGEEPNDG